MKSVILILCIVCIAGCRSTDVEPQEVSSFSYRSDGTRHIMPVAAPKITRTISANTTAGFSTTPLPLPNDKGLAIGTRDGALIIFTKNDSTNTSYLLHQDDPVYRLAANSETIIALHQSGAITATGFDGKVKWQLLNSLLRPDMNVCGNTLLVIAENIIILYDVATGQQSFIHASELTHVAAASDGTDFYVALSWNATSGSDSVYKISQTGNVEARWGFPGMRIVSNIAIAGEDHDQLVFGAQGEPDESGIRRRTYVLAFELEEGKQNQLLRQELEYIPTNVSVINNMVLASGFQMGKDDYAGAVDAFSLEGNDKLWQRRFTEPLGSPVAVTTQHAFFTLTFASDASIPSNALFYALDLSNGQTVREFGITDAHNGFVPGLPIPYKGALLVADAVTNTIYSLITE